MAPAANGTGDANGAAVDLAIALAPCDFPSVPGLVGDIASLGKTLTEQDRDGRLALLEKARSLVRALETPRETMLKHVGAQTVNFVAISWGVEMGLFKLMAEDGGSPKKVVDLAAKIGVEEDLLARMIRHIAAMGYITETGPDEYKPNNFSKALAIPVIGDGYPMYLFCTIPSLIYLNQFLKKSGYKAPTSKADTPYHFAHRTGLGMFPHLQANPPHDMEFNHHMGGYKLGRPVWMDKGVYPVQERLIDGFDGSAGDGVLLVDIAGSLGHDLDEFRVKWSGAPGALVLQDLPGVISQITDLHPKIKRMEYDFLTEQPVKGARAYYMHSILHDWPDDVCVKIVDRVKQAMRPGYSRFLVNEHVIPRTGANWEATYLDVVMMANFSSRERTEANWVDLLEGKCGLRICKIWSAGPGVESVIECEVPLHWSRP